MGSSEEQHKQRMQKIKAAHEARQARATIEKGLLIVHTGAGKGKTTAALGLLFRALGYGWKIAVVQFIKGSTETGEHATAGLHSDQIDWFTLGEGFTWDTQSRRRDTEVAGRAWQKSVELLGDARYDLVILDELNVVLQYEYLPLDAVLKTLRSKREDLHVIVTGRGAPDGLIELADLVTEMKLVKHPYAQGIKAQEGIEY